MALIGPNFINFLKLQIRFMKVSIHYSLVSGRCLMQINEIDFIELTDNYCIHYLTSVMTNAEFDCTQEHEL